MDADLQRDHQMTTPSSPTPSPTATPLLRRGVARRFLRAACRRDFRSGGCGFGSLLPSVAMRGKVLISLICGFLLAATVGWLCLTESQLSRLRLSVRFIGYTNALWGIRVGVIQVSNASPFAVVRGRSPTVVFDSPPTPVTYAPTGLRVLESGESETVMTESLTNGIRWRLMVVGERLGDDSYGIGREPRLRVWMRAVAFWLQDHGLRVPTPGPPPGREFSSNWVED